MNVNSFHGCGRLTRDAEYSQTQKGVPMSKFRLAINSYRGQQEETTFLNVLCFGKMAENLQPRLVKGRPVSIQGKLNIDDYEDENQNKRSSVCVMADEISLGRDPKESSDDNPI